MRAYVGGYLEIANDDKLVLRRMIKEEEQSVVVLFEQVRRDKNLQ